VTNTHGFMRIAKLEIPALCIGNALGAFAPAAQTLWIAALIKNGLLTTSQIGWLGSGELLLVAISTIATSACGPRVPARLVAVTAASLIAIANAVAVIPLVQTVVIGRLLNGLAMGALLASAVGAAARRQDAQRVFAVMQILGLLLGSTFYFASPILVGRYGAAGVFSFVAGSGVVAAFAVLFGFPEVAARATQVTRAAGASKLAPLLGCLAMASVAIGMSTVGTYIVVIGNGLGFGARTMGNLLGATFPLAMVGALLARILAERVGLLWPLLFGLAMVALNFFFLVSSVSAVFFGICVAVLDMAAMFYVPYAYALVSRVDSSGRLTGAAPAFIMIGNAAGPMLGGKLIGLAHFQVLAAVGAACVTAGMLLFVGTARLGSLKRPQFPRSIEAIGPDRCG
jgi:predicted MFS family arabinose efflux permease